MRYDLSAIEDWAARNGGHLIRQRGRGVLLEGLTPKALRAAGIEENGRQPLVRYEYVLSPVERQQIIVGRLLNRNGWLAIQELAAFLFVSRATLYKDLDELDEWLANRGLVLQRRPNAGVRVTGAESAWRRAAGDALAKILDPGGLAQLLRGQSHPAWDQGWAGELVPANIITAVARAARRAGEILQLQVADGAFLRLVIRLAVAVRRLQLGFQLADQSRSEPPGEALQGWRVAVTIAAEVEVATGVALPGAEVGALATDLAGAPLWVENARPAPAVEGAAEELTLAATLTGRAGALLGLPLLEDRELVQALALHLRPLFTRLQQGVTTDNPLLEDVKAKYPAVWRVANETARVLQAEWHLPIPPAEVGFIAIHFGAALERTRVRTAGRCKVLAVCGQGLGTARLLAARLGVQVPEAVVVGVTSVFNVAARLAQERCDLVVSTVPLRDMPVPVVEASPLITDEEAVRLRKAVADLAAGQHNTNEKGCQRVLTQLLTADRIALDVRASDWEEAVRASGDLLVQTGAATSEYIEAMVRNVREIGPYIVIAPGVAMPHARPEDGSIEVAISMVRLSTPVAFGHQANDPVDLVFALAAVDSEAHLTAIVQLSEFLGDQARVEALRRAASPDEALDVLTWMIPQGERG